MGKVINISDFILENKMRKEIIDCIDSISYNLSAIHDIFEYSTEDKEMLELIDSLHKILFPNNNGNGFVYSEEDINNYESEIATIDFILENELYKEISNVMFSSTYSGNRFIPDDADINYIKLLVNNTILFVKAIIDSSLSDVTDFDRKSVRSQVLKSRLNSVLFKAKLEGIIPFDFKFDKLDEAMEYISSHYYDLHFAIVERLFKNTLSDMNKGSFTYERYDIETRKASLCFMANTVRNRLNEEDYQEYEKISEYILNINDSKSLDIVESLLQFFDSVNFNIVDYPSVRIWKSMLSELANRLLLVIQKIANLDGETKTYLEDFRKYYLELKVKYFNQLFIGIARYYIDPNKTESEIRLLSRR